MTPPSHRSEGSQGFAGRQLSNQARAQETPTLGDASKEGNDTHRRPRRRPYKLGGTFVRIIARRTSGVWGNSSHEETRHHCSSSTSWSSTSWQICGVPGLGFPRIQTTGASESLKNLHVSLTYVYKCDVRLG